MTQGEFEQGKIVVAEIDEIQRLIDLITVHGKAIDLSLNGSPVTMDLPSGYSIGEITEVVRSQLIVNRSLKMTELANI